MAALQPPPKPLAHLATRTLSLPEGSATGEMEYVSRRQIAAACNERFVRALFVYGSRHGLPNIAPEECRQRLYGISCLGGGG